MFSKPSQGKSVICALPKTYFIMRSVYYLLKHQVRHNKTKKKCIYQIVKTSTTTAKKKENPDNNQDHWKELMTVQQLSKYNDIHSWKPQQF